MFYSSEAEALRTFIRDKLGLPATDVGDGWLIFDAPEADLGVHPTEGGNPPSGTADISFYCDDIEQTVAELARRGVEFTQDVEDHGLRAGDLLQSSGRLPDPAVSAEIRQVAAVPQVRVSPA